MPDFPSPYFPERLLAARARFPQLLSQFKEADFDNYVEATHELRDELRKIAPAWQTLYRPIPPQLLAQEPPRPEWQEENIPVNDEAMNAWFAWSRELQEYYIPRPRLEEELHATKALMAFHRAGRNIFALAPPLQEMLRHTAVDNVRWEDVALPYPSVYLHLGRESGIELPLEYYERKFDDDEQAANLVGVTYWLDGAFVEQSSHALDFTLTFRSSEDDFTRRVGLDSDFRFPVVQFSVDFAGHKVAPQGRTCAQATLVFASLWDAKQESMELAYGRMRELLAENKFEYESEQADYQLFQEVMTLLVNSLCYLSLPGQSVRKATTSPAAEDLLKQLRSAKNKQRRQPIQEKLAKLSYSTIRFCGEDILPAKPQGGGAGDVAPHWRRGHWRQQPWGTGRSEVKVTWIKPTIVRRDKGEPAQGHVYEVDPT